jgi:hypothetical protein
VSSGDDVSAAPFTRWSPELLHEAYDLLMACYMKDPANRGKRLSNTTLLELMLWSGEQVKASAAATCSGVGGASPVE